MRKLFSRNKNKDKDAAAGRDSRKLTTTSASQLESVQNDMQSYKGQRYNPAEDDGITTESLFKVIDGDTGEAIDVRELLGVTEEEFRANPELRDAIAHMNRIQPIEEEKGGAPEIEEEKKEEEAPDRKVYPMDQKARHFRYYEQLNTLPVRPTISDS